MGQELYVLKCFSCETFQSHIVKKTNKWECKVCQAKQSIKKVYGRGSGKDCRLHTQKLNSMNREKEETKLVQKVNEQEYDTRSGQSDYNIQLPFCSTDVKVDFPKSNNWKSYMNHDISDVNKENPPIQERTICSYDIEEKSDTVLKRKRKHDMHESYIVNKQTDNIECSDFKKDNLSAFCFANSISSKVKKYDARNFAEKYNDHKGFNVNYVDRRIEKNKKVISPSLIKEARKQKVENEINFKWAKYLVDESGGEESSHHQCEAISPMSMNSCASFNTNENPAIHCEREGDFTYKTGDFMLNQCSSFKSEKNSGLASKGPNNTLSVRNSLEEHDKNLHEIQMSRDLLRIKPQPLISLPVFEQNCDLDNSDFQLDF